MCPSNKNIFWVCCLATFSFVLSLTVIVEGQAERSENEDRSKTIAVVPFSNLSGSSSDEMILRGFWETLTAGVNSFPQLTVVWKDEFFQTGLSPAPVDSFTVENDLDYLENEQISWVVTGGFQRLDNRIRVTARIINLASGITIQTARIDGMTEELFTLQDRLLEELKLGLTLIQNAEDIESVEAIKRIQASIRRTTIEERQPSKTREQETADEHQAFGRAVDLQPATASNSPPTTARQTVRVPRIENPPRIDGHLNDLAWKEASHLTRFFQMTPLDGAPGSEETEVFIAFDSSHIYLGFYAHYENPGILRANRADRDEARGDDAFTVYFDPFLDEQRAYVFTVNAYGVQSDAILSMRQGGTRDEPIGFFGPPRGDASWDTLFDSGGQLVPDGFTAEVAIPFKSLRYPSKDGGDEHQWGFQVARNIRGKNETVVWSPMSRDVAGFLSQMGVLEGLTQLSTSRNIEFLPTFTGLKMGSMNKSSGTFLNNAIEPEGGINFKYGLTSNITADFTYNPDFSQIESDRPQIEVNQRFALFFPELRPFFLEGNEIFNFRGPVDLVHTRTIVNPRYGAKLTGKAGDLTIGMLYANDESPIHSEEETSDQNITGQESQTFVGRLRYDLYGESYVGAIVTDQEFIDSYNRVAGLDSNFRLGDEYSFGFRAVGTRDRDHEGVETSGYLLDASFRKDGRNLSYMLAHYALSPDFKTDVGFVRRTNQRFSFTSLSYRWWPESWLINWGPEIRYHRSYSFKGPLDDENASVGLRASFANNIRLDGDLGREMERFGGIDFWKNRYQFMGVVSSSRLFSYGVGGSGGDQIFFDEQNPYLGQETGWNVFLNLRLFSRLQSRINVRTNKFVNTNTDGNIAFDVNIFRALTTYQFSKRLQFRNISEYNSLQRSLGLNFLFTYRINAGTVFYFGYDDRYRQANRIDWDLNSDSLSDPFFQSNHRVRTNRAIFTKLQYLFRF